jgi:hypothetical protein
MLESADGRAAVKTTHTATTIGTQIPILLRLRDIVSSSQASLAGGPHTHRSDPGENATLCAGHDAPTTLR